MLSLACWHANASAAVVYFDQDEQVASVTLQLHATVAEFASAVLRLFNAGIYSPIPIVVRSAYEAFVEQLALERDPTYLKRMSATSIREGRELPKIMNDAGRDMLAAFLGQDGASEFLRRLKDEASKFDDLKASRTDPADKFEAAGCADEYPMYKLLSAAVHHDGGVLRERHILRDERGTERLILFRVPDAEWLTTNLEMMLRFVLISATKIYGQRTQLFSDLQRELRDMVQGEIDRGERDSPDLSKYRKADSAT